MSRGAPLRNFRCSDDEWAEVVRCAEFRNRNSADVEDSISDFIRKAIREKVAKMARSRGRPLTVADEVVDFAQLQNEQRQPELFPDTVEYHGAIS